MTRAKGSRNADYAQARARLVEAVRARVCEPGGAQASFRELAEVAGVSVATLRHYFGTREALLVEVMAAMHRSGLPFMHLGATEVHGSLRESVTWFLGFLLQGWTRGVGAMQAFGLTAGLGHETLGPAYVQELLEPTLQVAELRLARHMAEGEMRRCDVRHAALALVSPVVLALLHQGALSGARCRPLDVPRFLEDHVDAFVRAYAPAPGGG
jgi:AcrR family transcriptional regulator